MTIVLTVCCGIGIIILPAYTSKHSVQMTDEYKWVTCSACQGSGKYYAESCAICSDCGGKGFTGTNKDRCYTCSGTGTITKKTTQTCVTCNGRGTVKSTCK